MSGAETGGARRLPVQRQSGLARSAAEAGVLRRAGSLSAPAGTVPAGGAAPLGQQGAALAGPAAGLSAGPARGGRQRPLRGQGGRVAAAPAESRAGAPLPQPAPQLYTAPSAADAGALSQTDI